MSFFSTSDSQTLTAVLSDPPDSLGQGMLITAWVRRSTTANSSSPWAAVWARDTGLKFGIQTPNTSDLRGRGDWGTTDGHNGPTGMANEVWHLVGVLLGRNNHPSTTTIRTFVNDTPFTSTTINGVAGADGLIPHLLINKPRSGPGLGIRGWVAEIAVWTVDGANSTGEAQAIMAELFTGKKPIDVTAATPHAYLPLLADSTGSTGLASITPAGTPVYDASIHPVMLASPIPDTTAPILSLPTLTAPTPTTLTGGFTSNEIGRSWSVLTPGAQADPTEAQIRAGQGATGAAAVATSLNTPMIGGVNTRNFTGATAGTAYKVHTISQDTAAAPNVSNIVRSSSVTTPVTTLTATVTLTTDGSTAAANLTGLTALAGGATGTLLVLTSDGAAGSTANRAYCAPVVVS